MPPRSAPANWKTADVVTVAERDVVLAILDGDSNTKLASDRATRTTRSESCK